MRVATWNINGLRARLDYLRFWLQARKPDVVGLQELKITDDEFPTEFFSELGYHATTYGQKAWNGVAVLSLRPAEVLERGLPGEDEFGSRLLRVKVDDLQFTTVYCPERQRTRPRRFPEEARVVRFAVALLGNAGPQRAGGVCAATSTSCRRRSTRWLTGDTDDLIFHTKAERDRFAALLDLGLADLFRASPSRQAGVLVVGLPRRRIPQRARAADRHGAGNGARSRSA